MAIRDTWGSNDASEAFAAKVEIDTSSICLCLAIGNDISPRSAVSAVGMRIIAELGEARILALGSLEQTLQLSRHRDVRTAGPVTIDPLRFRQFATLISPKEMTSPVQP